MPEQARPEKPDVATGPVVWIALGFLAFVGVTVAGLLLYFHLVVAGDLARPPKVFADPQLQAAPREDRARIEARQAALLHGHAWVDRAAGVARIPIEEAMGLLAARGEKAYDPPGTSPGARAEAQP